MSINGLDPAQNEYIIAIHVLSSMDGCAFSKSQGSLLLPFMYSVEFR